MLMLKKINNFLFNKKKWLLICLCILLLIIIVCLYNDNFYGYWLGTDAIKPDNSLAIPTTSDNLTNVKPVGSQVLIDNLSSEVVQVNTNVRNYVDMNPSSSYIAEQELQDLRARQQPRIDLENQLARQREIHRQNLFKAFVISLFVGLLAVIVIEEIGQSTLTTNDKNV